MVKIAALAAVFFLRLTQWVVANKVEITAHGQVVGADEGSFAAVDLNKDGFISRDEHAHHQRGVALAAEKLSLTSVCGDTKCCHKEFGKDYEYAKTGGNAANCKAK